MNTFLKRLSTGFIALTMFVLAGCASNGLIKSSSLGDGDKVFASAVIRVDRLVTKTSELEGTVYELDAVQIGFKETNGEWVTYFDKELKRQVPAISRFHRETRTTPFGQTVTLTFVGGVVPSIVQGEYAKKIAEMTSCKPGSICADNVNVNNNDLAAIATGGVGVGGSSNSSAGAVAGAQAGSTSGATINNGTTKPDVPTPCKTCGVKPKAQ